MDLDPQKERGHNHRPLVFDKMEGLVREMQDPEGGVPVRSQKSFLTSVPSAFMGYDLIEWLMERLNIEESESLNLANQLCMYGYFFPVNDTRNLTVKDDSSLYRFQNPIFWPCQVKSPDSNIDYAIFLTKRTLRNKQRHGLDDFEWEALTNLKKNLTNKWDIVTSQVELQLKQIKERRKGDRTVFDSQERAYWRVLRPPPGCVTPLEPCPVPTRVRDRLHRKRTVEECARDVEKYKMYLQRVRFKNSTALEGVVNHIETYSEYDPMIMTVLPSNPWVSDDTTFWQLYAPIVEQACDKRVKRWALSIEDLVSDVTGLNEFTNYLRKEYSHENIRFWLAVNDLRHCAQSQVQRKVSQIHEEFLAPGAPCEINIDGKTLEKVHQELRTPTRFAFDSAAEHVYLLLLKKDCYPRFIRSDHYKSLLASSGHTSHKKRFFGFVGQTKKKFSSSMMPTMTTQTMTMPTPASTSAWHQRRGSERSLTGSTHEIHALITDDTHNGNALAKNVHHSHSQTNISNLNRAKNVSALVTAKSSDVVEQIVEPRVVDLLHTQASSTRKPSIAPSSSVSEDISAQCEYNDSRTSLEHAKVKSRKNSQMEESGGSSSDLSCAPGYLSQNYLATQRTFDSDTELLSCKKVAANSRKHSKKHTRKLSSSSCIEMSTALISATACGTASALYKRRLSATPALLSNAQITSDHKPIVYLLKQFSNPPQNEILKPVRSDVSINLEECETVSCEHVDDDRGKNDEKNVECVDHTTQMTTPITGSDSVPINTPHHVETIPLSSHASEICMDIIRDILSNIHSPLKNDHVNDDDKCTGQSTDDKLLKLAPLAVPDTQSPMEEEPPTFEDVESSVIVAQEPHTCAQQQLDLNLDDIASNVGDRSTDISPQLSSYVQQRPKIVHDEKSHEIICVGEAGELAGEQDPVAGVSTAPLVPVTVVSTTGASDGKEPQNLPSDVTKVEDVCPWEDEDACQSDEPFVKTYSTLGYL